MSSLDFLLECIGFPPDTNSADLVQRVLAEGEGVPGRGDPAFHRRLVVGEGLELRLDREDDQDFWTLLPHYRVPHRLRVAVESLRSVEDSPFDALLIGWAAPPTPQELAELSGEQRRRAGAYRFATWLTDARRLPSEMNVGHVLAISVAGFALGVDAIFPSPESPEGSVLELERGCRIEPLNGPDAPAGCSRVSARIRELRSLRNRLTGGEVRMVIADAPERPLVLFLSPWQLCSDSVPAPRPGHRIEGTFLFTGHIAGGLTGPRARAGRDFG
jgi:hypothetical protein